MEALGDVFVASGLSVRELMRALFNRPEFYTDLARRAGAFAGRVGGGAPRADRARRRVDQGVRPR
ncbi:MAG: hypothetical protein R2713_07595 [Ilumatobacteraceae bacterium]